jgi:hypothetical protein
MPRQPESLTRACIECPAIYRGALICPQCGAFGEPLDTPQNPPGATNAASSEEQASPDS